MTSGLMSSWRDTSGLYLRLGRTIESPLVERQGTQGPNPFATVILGYLSIFKRTQASSPLEALNSTCLSGCQGDMRPSGEMRRGSKAFSMVCTGDSDIPSSWEMKDKPAFKSLQGTPALFRDRASRFPSHSRLQTQCPAHIPIAERSLLLRCLWKAGISLEWKPGNQFSS